MLALRKSAGLRQLPYAVVLAWLLAASAHALDLSKLEPTGHVNDFAGVLDPQAAARIESYCRDVEAATQAEIAVVTVKSLDGDTIEDAAIRLFEKWKIGKEKTDEGALVILAIEDRQNRIEVGYGLEPIIPDGAAGGILRSIRPLLRQGDYGSALLSAVQQMGDRIAAAKGVAIAGRSIEAPPYPGSPEPGNIGGVIIGFIFLMFILSLFFGGRGGRGGRGGGMGNFATWMLLNALMSQGGRHRGGRGGGWSHGGFGGGGGNWGGGGFGGGFGGFGGGSSGGGGASSNW